MQTLNTELTRKINRIGQIVKGAQKSSEENNALEWRIGQMEKEVHKEENTVLKITLRQVEASDFKKQ